MQTFHLKVGPDGHVTIPNTHPGPTVTVQITAGPDVSDPDTIPEEDRDAIKEQIMATCTTAKTDCRSDDRHARARHHRPCRTRIATMS